MLLVCTGDRKQKIFVSVQARKRRRTDGARHLPHLLTVNRACGTRRPSPACNEILMISNCDEPKLIKIPSPASLSTLEDKSCDAARIPQVLVHHMELCRQSVVLDVIKLPK